MQDCANLVASVAADTTCSDRERFEALLALAALGDSRLALDGRCDRHAGSRVVPNDLRVGSGLCCIRSTCPKPNWSSSWHEFAAKRGARGIRRQRSPWVIPTKGRTSAKPALKPLLPNVLQLARRGLSVVEEEFQEADGRLELSSILRSLSPSIAGAWKRQRDTDRGLGNREAVGRRIPALQKGKKELSELLDALPATWRQRVFEADLACVESLGGDRSARYRLVRIVYEGALELHVGTRRPMGTSSAC